MSNIETRSEAAIGAHAVLDIVANAGDAFDAIVIAAFIDPGVKAAKEVRSVRLSVFLKVHLRLQGLSVLNFLLSRFRGQLPLVSGVCHGQWRLYRLASIHSLSTPLKNIATVQRIMQNDLWSSVMHQFKKTAQIASFSRARLLRFGPATAR